MTETIDLAFAIRAFYGSSGQATTAVYRCLEELGPTGALAMNLMRASKTSERAKKYRGGNQKGSFRAQSYDVKQWAIGNVCDLLKSKTIPGVDKWGWGIDKKLFEDGAPHYHVLYVDIPTGQVSFHTHIRKLDCPDYPGEWDGITGKSADRILRFIGRLLGDKQAEAA